MLVKVLPRNENTVTYTFTSQIIVTATGELFCPSFIKNKATWLHHKLKLEAKKVILVKRYCWKNRMKNVDDNTCKIFLFYASFHLWLNIFSFNKGCTGICKGEENVQWASTLSKHKHSCTDLGPAFVVEVEELPLVDDVAIFLTQLEHLKTKSMMRVITCSHWPFTAVQRTILHCCCSLRQELQ